MKHISKITSVVALLLNVVAVQQLAIRGDRFFDAEGDSGGNVSISYSINNDAHVFSVAHRTAQTVQNDRNRVRFQAPGTVEEHAIINAPAGPQISAYILKLVPLYKPILFVVETAYKPVHHETGPPKSLS